MRPHVVFLTTILAEFGRGLSAARRYESLRYRCACREGLAPADIPRRIFEEFYAGERDSEDAAIVPDEGRFSVEALACENAETVTFRRYPTPLRGL